LRGTSAAIAAIVVTLLLFQAPATPAAAQVPVTATDSLRMRVDSLTRQLDSLRAVIAALPRQPAAEAIPDTLDPIARIRAAAAAAAGGGTPDTTAAAQQPDEATQFIGRQRNLNALNPEISVTGNLFAFSRSDDATADNFAAREFEISFISNLDPFSRAKVFVAHHLGGGEILPFGEHAHDEDPDLPDEAATEEEGHGGETEIEEGYVEWVGLAGGLGLTVGKFRQRFGRLNRWHAHALPGQQYPLPILAFLGEEGLAQAGVSAHWLLPLHGFGTWEVWGELTRSSSDVLFGEDNGLSGLGHLNAFFELSPATYFEVGVSALTGGRDADPAENGAPATGNRLYGIDLTFDWRPPGQSRYRQLTLTGGAMLNRRVYDGADNVDAWGGYVSGEFKFAQQWIAGARYERVENPDEPGEHASLFAPSLTWWQSEYVRLRAEYDFFRGVDDDYGQLVLQATFAMGPHKHENY
jgi:hypothetical protein